MNKMDLERIIIQKATIGDLDEVLAIESSSFPNPWSKNMLIEEILNPLAHFFIAKFKGDLKNHPLLGFICFRNMGEESELLNLSVHPQYRQLGVAKNLLQFYVNFCEKVGIKRFYLEVNSLNQSAIHLYRHFSYQSVGVRKKFYQGKFDALLMRKEM